MRELSRASERWFAERPDGVGELLAGSGRLVAGALAGVVDGLHRAVQEPGDLYAVVEPESHQRIDAELGGELARSAQRDALLGAEQCVEVLDEVGIDLQEYGVEVGV